MRIQKLEHTLIVFANHFNLSNIYAYKGSAAEGERVTYHREAAMVMPAMRLLLVIRRDTGSENTEQSGAE